MSNAKGQVPLQVSAEFVRTYNAQVPKMVDAIAAAVLGAQAGLNWLRADPPDLKEVRRASTVSFHSSTLGEQAVGKSSEGLADLRRERIGFVFQGYNLFPTLTAVENVMVALDVRQVAPHEPREPG